MGREIKRVALDFEWPLGKTWTGYLMPDELSPVECRFCGGSGYSPHGLYLKNLWYGNESFRPEDNGSIPLTPDTPAVRDFAERNVRSSPEYYGHSPNAIYWEAKRLADMWNGAWSHHLNQEDVDALTQSGRLRGLPEAPTPEQVNEWDIRTMGHDSVNAFICIRARCEREGISDQCAACDGEGTTWRDADHRAAHDAWEPTEPPVGEGWQMWETVSEGSPISPVFATADGLIEWMTSPDAHWGASGPWPRDVAEKWVRGDGWAPTLVTGPDGRLVDGVTAITQIRT